MKDTNAKQDVERWFNGAISTGRLVRDSNLCDCQQQAEGLLGGIWQVLHEKAYALDAELERRIKVASDFKALAEVGDAERTAKDDITLQSSRMAVLQEARSLLRLYLLGCIDRTEAGR